MSEHSVATAGAAMATQWYALMLQPLANSAGDVGGLCVMALSQAGSQGQDNPLAQEFAKLLKQEERAQ